MTERYTIALAEHIARYRLKRQIVEAGQRLSDYTAKEIAIRVRRIVRNDPWYGETAERVLAEAKERKRVDV